MHEQCQAIVNACAVQSRGHEPGVAEAIQETVWDCQHHTQRGASGVHGATALAADLPPEYALVLSAL